MQKLSPKLFCSIITIMFAVNVDAQTSNAPTKIEFDFSTKQFTDPDALDKLKPHEWFQLVINRINLNLYKVTFDKADSSVKSNITTPDFTSFNLDNLTKLVGG